MTRLRHAVAAAATAVLAALTAASVVAPAHALTPRKSKAYDTELRAAINDIQGFWTASMPKVYGHAYLPLSHGVYAYSAGSVIPKCGSDLSIPYHFVANNAFYCKEGDFVAWDDEGLFPELYSKYGSFAMGVVLAHEWGHVIQARAGIAAFEVQHEQQADCFAGAWTSHVARGGTKVKYELGDLEAAMQAFVGFADKPGYSAKSMGAHGNAFDRVAAFQDGFDNGARKCAAYATSAPTMTEQRYRTMSDALHRGNATWEEAIPLVKASLVDYWGAQGQTNPVVLQAEATDRELTCKPSDRLLADPGIKGMYYCKADDTLRMDVKKMFRLLQARGDFALGTLMAEGWAKTMQFRSGVTIETPQTRRQADCWAGAWAGAAFRGEGSNRLNLSPGDLDESVDVILEGAKRGEPTATFARVGSFRKGFFADRKACP